MRRFTLILALATAGLLAACAGPASLDPYPEECITPTAPCPPGGE